MSEKWLHFLPNLNRQCTGEIFHKFLLGTDKLDRFSYRGRRLGNIRYILFIEPLDAREIQSRFLHKLFIYLYQPELVSQQYTQLVVEILLCTILQYSLIIHCKLITFSSDIRNMFNRIVSIQFQPGEMNSDGIRSIIEKNI